MYRYYSRARIYRARCIPAARVLPSMDKNAGRHTHAHASWTKFEGKIAYFGRGPLWSAYASSGKGPRCLYRATYNCSLCRPVLVLQSQVVGGLQRVNPPNDNVLQDVGQEPRYTNNPRGSHTSRVGDARQRLAS